MQISFDFKHLKSNRLLRFFLGLAAAAELLLCLWLFTKTHKIPAAAACLPGLAIAAGLKIRIEKPLPAAVFHGVALLLLSVTYLLLTRSIVGCSLSEMYRFLIFLNLLVFCVFVSLLYVISGSSRFAYSAALTFLIGVEILNRFICQFRTLEITPVDLLSLRTAFSVSASYRPDWEPAILEALMLTVFLVYFICSSIRVRDTARRRLAAVALLLLQAGILYWGIGNIQSHHWANDGTVYNGFPVNFLKTATEMSIPKPEGYTVDRLKELESEYPAQQTDTEPAANIIVIMNESFADLCVYSDDIRADKEILPYWDSLTENTIKGYALSSVYGGNTPNSEWEFLTGNTMGFLPSGSIPYLTYIPDTGAPTLLDTLKAQGYRCVAMHPFYSSGWKRASVYPSFGFDESLFLSEFPQQNLVNNFVSDEEMYDQVFRQFEKKTPGERLFVFGVTIQNHGGYEPDETDFPSTVSLSGAFSGKEAAEVYLSEMCKSDAALEKLVSYFQKVPERTVILFFGDHQPALSSEYIRTLLGRDPDAFEDIVLQYKIPFFLWANYDISEKEIPCTSLNYLSNYLYQTAGLPATGYSRFLAQAESVIPAMNVHGYYSLAQQRFIPYSDAAGEEAALLEKYRILQYNNIFDRGNSVSLFDPA